MPSSLRKWRFMSLSCVFVFSCFPVHFESINWFWTIVTKWQGPLQPALRASWKLLYSRSLLPWIDHVCPTRHCTQGLSSPYISMRSCCKGTCWSALCWPVLCTGGCYERGDSPGCQEMIPGSVCHTNKVHHSMRGREAEPVYWQDLHSTPWENPCRLHPALNQCTVPSIRSNIRFTRYLYSSFCSVLLKWLFYQAIFCWTFLAEMQKEPCTISLSPALHPSLGQHIY